MSFEGNEGPAAEEDIYGGFNEHDNALEDPLGDGEDDAGFAEAVKTSYGNRPIKVPRCTLAPLTVIQCSSR